MFLFFSFHFGTAAATAASVLVVAVVVGEDEVKQNETSYECSQTKHTNAYACTKHAQTQIQSCRVCLYMCVSVSACVYIIIQIFISRWST